MERKLTAILCADVHGYSRLMGEDEEVTFRTLASHRKIIDALIQRHQGRFVNSAGDSVLAEFASVVNAVQCATEIQDALKTENAEFAPERRMEFRIGVNLGDVIVDGEQIYGDGVNVAARLESLAEPGGICISHAVHDHIKNKLAFGYADVGHPACQEYRRAGAGVAHHDARRIVIADAALCSQVLARRRIFARRSGNYCRHDPAGAALVFAADNYTGVDSAATETRVAMAQ
jgi:class 3 adenylate cyclase